jgi:hypothetical protein
MRRKFLIATAGIALSAPVASFAQAYDIKKDTRNSVMAFADELATLSRVLHENPNFTETNAPLPGLLDHLDFTTMNQPDVLVRAYSRQNAERLAVNTAAQSLQNYRPDKQVSASSNTSGTTSLVSTAGASDLLSLTLDVGALTRSVNGTTATINGNFDGMFRALTGYSPLCVSPCPSFPGWKLQWVDQYLLDPINVSVVTALAQQSTTTAPAGGQASGSTSIPLSTVAIPAAAGKVTSVVARYQILNKYDPHSESFKQKWEAAKQMHSDFVSKPIETNNSILAVRDAVMKTATPLDRDGIIAAAKRGDKDLADFFSNYYQSQVQKFDAGVSSVESQAVQEMATNQQLWETVRQEAAGALFTLEYSYNRPLNQPETHDFKIIYGYAPGIVSGMLSLNGAISLYGGTLPAGAKYGRLRDCQISGEYDHLFNIRGNPNVLSLSLASYWQYQPNPSILNIPAGTVAPGTTIPIPNGTQEFVGTAGSLWVTQAKITINVKSGINIPIGVKWSNKSDLLSGNKVGAQVGISYDCSSLSNLFGGNAAK